MAVVMSISDKITVLHQGIVIAEGSPEEVQQNEKVKRAYLGGFEHASS
jgi:branched-chain amino acid transport system ATP-binding protein